MAEAIPPRPLRMNVEPPKHLDFVYASTKWSGWLKRFKRYRNISGLSEQSEGVQIDALIYALGKEESEDIYEQFTIDGDETFDKVVAAFTNYFQPRSNILHNRMQFYNRKQNPDETAEEYIQCIHSLAVKCKFNAGLTQDDMIKDRLLSGMMDN